MRWEHGRPPQDAPVSRGRTLGVTWCAGLMLAAAAAFVELLFPRAAVAQEALVIRPLSEQRVTQLPAGPIFWRIETFPTLAAAQAAAGPTSLVAQSSGRIWLFTLGPQG